MRYAALALANIALLLTGCEKHHGPCLARHRAPQVMIMQPHMVGKVMILTPMIIPAHDVCDRWDDGKPS